jgi:hypothetical protein
MVGEQRWLGRDGSWSVGPLHLQGAKSATLEHVVRGEISGFEMQRQVTDPARQLQMRFIDVSAARTSSAASANKAIAI